MVSGLAVVQRTLFYLYYTDDVVTALDNRLYTITIFLDLSNKDIMLNKLDRLGFINEAIAFFDSYLSDRRMYVSVNGCNSDIRTTNIGLPQGSVSAAWLFSLNVNDMNKASDRLKFIHFAEDTTIYMRSGNLTRLCADVCDELDLIDDWLKANRLSLTILTRHALWLIRITDMTLMTVTIE